MALSYLFSWFTVDFISVVPFDLILLSGNVNRVARFTRIGKLYKLIRMTRRAIKIIANIILTMREMLSVKRLDPTYTTR
mgnify:CR=1 FL=1